MKNEDGSMDVKNRTLLHIFECYDFLSVTSMFLEGAPLTTVKTFSSNATKLENVRKSSVHTNIYFRIQMFLMC